MGQKTLKEQLWDLQYRYSYDTESQSGCFIVTYFDVYSKKRADMIGEWIANAIYEKREREFNDKDEKIKLPRERKAKK